MGTFRDTVYVAKETTLQPFNRLFVFNDGAYEIVRQNGSMLTLDELVQQLIGWSLSDAGSLENTLSQLENPAGAPRSKMTLR